MTNTTTQKRHKRIPNWAMPILAVPYLMLIMLCAGNVTFKRCLLLALAFFAIFFGNKLWTDADAKELASRAAINYPDYGKPVRFEFRNRAGSSGAIEVWTDKGHHYEYRELRPDDTPAIIFPKS